MTTQTQPNNTSLSSWNNAIQETRRSWSEMIRPGTLPRDISAGLSVACVALPLNLALASAAGLPPGVGLVTGVVAGVVAGFLGGSRLQVTGPEAALLPLTAGIVHAHGASGLEMAVLICGVLQLVMGFLRVGRLIRWVPPPVVGGFTAGIGLLLLNRQLPRMLGLDDEHKSVAQLCASSSWFSKVEVAAIVLGLVMMATMMLLPKLRTRLPAVLVGLVVVTAGAWVGRLNLPLVGELPRSLPIPDMPHFSVQLLGAILPSALMLTLLASMGSLLATTSLDTLLKDPNRRGNYDQELVAQGLANLVSAAFGGLPVMGAIVRATASVQAGAQTRAASVSHALWLLVAMLVAAPLVSHIPNTALAAILVVVGGRLLNLKGLAEMAKRSAVSAAILVATAVLIVTTNFLFGVAMGLVMSAFRHLIQHSRLSIDLQFLQAHSLFGQRGLMTPHAREKSSAAVLVKLAGPLFFLNHSRLYRLIDGTQWPRLLVLDLSGVPFIDSAGQETLQYLAEFLAIRGSQLAVVGAQSGVAEDLRQTAQRHFAGARVHESLPAALKSAGWVWQGTESPPVYVA